MTCLPLSTPTSGASTGVTRPDPKPSVVLIGFMGAGKSTVARRLAGREQIVDTDQLVTDQIGMPIDRYFEEHGEAAFREVEERVVCEALETADGRIVSLGGGSVLSQRVRESLGRHVVVWLSVDLDQALSRTSGTKRPLAQDPTRFAALMAEREPLYLSLADAVVPADRTATVAAGVAMARNLAHMPPGTKMLWASSSSGEYPVVVGDGILGNPWWPLEGRRFCITDTNVGALYADSVAPLAAQIEISPGEQAKTMAEAELVLRELARSEMTRSDHVVALGGGVVGDLAGFCAHTYQRGVPVVQVPTTLVAQVDSAYGGKTGVDLPEAKNYVGAYHMPSAVITDTGALRTLPGKEMSAGFVEVLKTALLAGGVLWEEVRQLGPGGITGQPWVVFECARYKCSVVAADERDSGLRQVLNLGHTVGHGIEAATGYRRYRHGEAIGLGLLAALRLSGAPGLRQQVEQILVRHDLPVRIEGAVDVSEVLSALGRDKKRTSEGVPFVTLEQPGRPVTGQILDLDDVESAIKELLE